MSKVFASGPHPHLNACVGKNTYSDNSYGYMAGFAQATEVLLAAAKTQYFEDTETGETKGVFMDALIYPICFCMRHHIELFLKRQLSKISRFRNPSREVPPIHELGELLTSLKEVCEEQDRRLPSKLALLETTIAEFDRIDPTGQTFRYSTATNGTHHLEDLNHINLGVLGEKVKRFNAAADEFDTEVEVIEAEYRQMTFTKKLSRADLYELAAALPPKKTWADPSGCFDQVKTEFTGKYCLSANDFSTAVDAIKGHRYFSSLIGVPLPLPHIEVQDINFFANDVHAHQSASELTQEKWAAWHAIYEVGAPHVYCEYFDFFLTLLLDEESEVCAYPPDVVRLARTSPSRFLRGLKKAGQIELSNQFEQIMAKAIKTEEARKAS